MSDKGSAENRIGGSVSGAVVQAGSIGAIHLHTDREPVVSWEALADVPRQVATLAELCELSRLRGRLEEAAEFGARGLRLVDDVRGVGEELRLYTVPTAVGFINPLWWLC